MVEKLTIAERIDRKLKAILTAIDGITECHRQDFRADDLIPGHAYLFDEGENAQEGGMSNEANCTTSVQYEVIIGVCIALSGEADEIPAAVVKRWHGKIHAAVVADPDLTDEFSQSLCNDMGGIEYLASNSLQLEADQTEIFAVRRYRFPYQMYRNDPYAGPGITEQTA